MINPEKIITPYSVLASTYAMWEEYKVPAIFYRYFLAVLNNIDKKKQIALMSRQIKTLKMKSHPYHRILNSIYLRERSLGKIEANIHILRQSENANEIQIPSLKKSSRIENQGEFLVVNGEEQKSADVQLVNSIKLYQQTTLQIIYMISQWMTELKSLNYEGFIVFEYRKQNYLTRINSDAKHIVTEYSDFFIDNPFLIMKKQHQNTQYSFLFSKLKFTKDQQERLNECLDMLAQNKEQVRKQRMLAEMKQKGRKRTIQKLPNINKIYKNQITEEDYIRHNGISMVRNHKSDHNLVKKQSLNLQNIPELRIQQKYRYSLRPAQSQSQNTEKRKKLEKIEQFQSQKEKIVQNEQIQIKKKVQVSEEKKKIIKKQIHQISPPKVQEKSPKKIQQKAQIQIIEESQLPNRKINKESKAQNEKLFVLHFEENVKETEIVKYLKTSVFTNTSIQYEQVQKLAKKFLKEKQFVTFILVFSNKVQVAWLAVKFVEKKNSLNRSVEILFVQKFVKLSNFQKKLLDIFISHGYGIIRNEKKILYELDLIDRFCKPLVKIRYRVNQKVEKKEIKKIMKKNKTMEKSRILKYHSYSKNTKYHKYCEHSVQECCIYYNFIDLWKIKIGRETYIKGKPDQILKINEDTFKIVCSINDTDLVISKDMNKILDLQRQNLIEKDSSVDEIYVTDFTHVAIKQGKIMKKYLNSQNDSPIIEQFININDQIIEVISITMNKEEVPNTLLTIQPPYFMSILTRTEKETKSLAMFEFQ